MFIAFLFVNFTRQYKIICVVNLQCCYWWSKFVVGTREIYMQVLLKYLVNFIFSGRHCQEPSLRICRLRYRKMHIWVGISRSFLENQNWKNLYLSPSEIFNQLMFLEKFLLRIHSEYEPLGNRLWGRVGKSIFVSFRNI